jgi:hypothetical protein
MTLAAGLRVVQWPEPIRNTFHLVELPLINLMRLVIDNAIALIVKAHKGLWESWAHCFGPCLFELRSIKSRPLRQNN